MKNKIYLITPAWLIKKKDFLSGIKKLNQLGFKILNKKFLKRTPSVKEKVKELHQAFLNRETEIILAQRGGFGSMKLLPGINFELIKENPKIFAGFSDLSVFLNTIYERTGLVTYHSPMLINLSNLKGIALKSFLNAIGGNDKEKNLFAKVPVKVFKHGIATGTLKGGNLITLSALIGTEWELETKNSILFFEEVDEKLYKVDRCLSQWFLAGKFRKIKGLILGNFRGLKTSNIFAIIKEMIKVTFPVVYCPYLGHTKNKITLPVGAKVKLNTYNKSLMLEK
ncbi:MAG TPA: LD-carboxypeptidase [Elusimicrobia bacterium]|jgi:muramoyltetrapeptide carboxypeptidase|nr:LD-carboxypeptidase [Elusimicrobiota bacterium]